MITAQALIEKFKYALENDWGYIWGTAGEKWTALKQANIEKTTDKDRENARRYGSKWIGHYVADCSGLFAWAFKQLGGYMYHGSNTMYKSYCTSKGTMSGGKRTDGQELKPGTAVFTGTEKEHGHVGLYIGDGLVIEAKGTQYGVIKSKVTQARWTFWGELKGVDYGSEPGPGPDPEKRPTLRRGDKGAYVTLLQTELINKGYSCGATGADGDFGRNTEAAVRAFQAEHNGPDGKELKVDGVVGQSTWWALDSAPERMTYTVTIKNLTASQKDRLKYEYPAAIVTPAD